MKRRWFFAGLIIAFIIEIAALIVFAVRSPDYSQDVVAVNEIVRTVTRDFNSLDAHENGTALDYVVIDADGKVLYRTKDGLSEDVNSAVAHRDTVLDIKKDGAAVGKVIIYNGVMQTFNDSRNTVIIVVTVILAVQCAICIGYDFYLHKRVVKPFKKMKGFAERVATGNLDIPLEMDKDNIFGAFTESFDIMRSELKKARLAEAQAVQSKKELVAKLSHDIKTPVASIKAVSEVGLAVAKSEKEKENYTQVINKADQINTLVTNLFSATLEELQQLSVTPDNIESTRVKSMLENADYLKRAAIPDIPQCLIFADGLRLQQVFDNIFANSYKYADTEITVKAEKSERHLRIIIEDSGGGVDDGELAVIKEKFVRGGNAKNIEGAGLGLYISDYFMKEMRGELNIENGDNGLRVTVSLLLSGAI